MVFLLVLYLDRRGVVLSMTESKSMNKSQSRDTVISNKGFEAPDVPVSQVVCIKLSI